VARASCRPHVHVNKREMSLDERTWKQQPLTFKHAGIVCTFVAGWRRGKKPPQITKLGRNPATLQCPRPFHAVQASTSGKTQKNLGVGSHPGRAPQYFHRFHERRQEEAADQSTPQRDAHSSMYRASLACRSYRHHLYSTVKSLSTATPPQVCLQPTAPSHRPLAFRHHEGGSEARHCIGR